VLPSGRFAVLGGVDDRRADAEAFDPVSRAWQPLFPIPRGLPHGAAVAMAGGLLAVGGYKLAVGGEDHAGAMLFEEESGRWFTLPGQMPTGREQHALATVPAP
jgi:hypothetical protein